MRFHDLAGEWWPLGLYYVYSPVCGYLKVEITAADMAWLESMKVRWDLSDSIPPNSTVSMKFESKR